MKRTKIVGRRPSQRLIKFLTAYCGMARSEAAALSEEEASDRYHAKIQAWMRQPDLAPKHYKEFVQSSQDHQRKG